MLTTYGTLMKVSISLPSQQMTMTMTRSLMNFEFTLHQISDQIKSMVRVSSLLACCRDSFCSNENQQLSLLFIYKNSLWEGAGRRGAPLLHSSAKCYVYFVEYVSSATTRRMDDLDVP
ncbi:unnamed protein product [Heterosigma akashiwo]|mmetsp:Transcript_14/g.29  ORF Transcript_14/g.29 Transcript_14/m.29 type:complete len:118 (+) Transcript_14:743-1096(+)